MNNLKRAIDTELRHIQTTEQEQAMILNRVLEGKKVKRHLSAALALTLILVLLVTTALAVTAISGHLRFMKSEEGLQALSCTIDDNTLYMFTNDGLMQWQPSDEAPVQLLDWYTMNTRYGISIYSLLFHTDSLMLLDPCTNTIWRYKDEAFEKALTLHGTTAQFYQNNLSDPAVAGGCLFIRAASEDESVIWQIDLATGQADTLAIENISEMISYRDGELLILQYDAPDSKTILSIDAQSGEVLERIVSAALLEIEGIAYDIKSDTIYAIRSGVLSRWDGSQWVSLQTASIPTFSYFFGMMDGGYIAAGYSGIQFISLDAESTAPALVIRGYKSLTGIEDAFVQANPGVQIQRENLAQYSGADIAAALQAGDAVDLFRVRLDAAVIRLMEEGLLAPLSQSDIIADDIALMLPQVQAAIAPSGTPCALPDEMQIMLWMIRTDAAEPQPRTILELLSQDVAWNAEAHTGAMYVANDYNSIPWSKEDYARYALTQTMLEAEAAGTAPDFSAQGFTAFLEMLKGAALSADAQPSRSSVVTANSYFSPRGKASDEASLAWQMMDAPAVTLAGTDTIPANLIVYVLNPHSQNTELALDFLEYASQHRSAQEQALLSPDTAEPSLYAYAQEYEELQSLPESWEISADGLAVYQTDIAPNLSLQFSPYSGSTNIMLGIVTQYLNGEITLAQCTAQLNAVVAGEAAN